MRLDPSAAEQRLIEAFRANDRVQPSQDLWTRVVHSIDEDQAHRKRVAVTWVACLAVLVALAAVAIPFRRHDLLGTSIDPWAFEGLETIALCTLIALLGPGIRRFGRGYAADLWPSDAAAASGILRLLDVAYFLVLGGYVMVTARFDHVDSPLSVVSREHLQDQLSSASLRIGGLLLLIGVLHAVTMLALPFVALVHNATRRRAALPRWLTVVGTVVLAWLALQVVGLLLLGLIAAAS